MPLPRNDKCREIWLPTGPNCKFKCCCYTIYKLWRNPSQQVLAFGRCVPQQGFALADVAARRVAWHGQACAGTVDNTVSSGEITEATDNVHCRAAYFRFTVGKIPIRIDPNGRSGACHAGA